MMATLVFAPVHLPSGVVCVAVVACAGCWVSLFHVSLIVVGLQDIVSRDALRTFFSHSPNAEFDCVPLSLHDALIMLLYDMRHAWRFSQFVRYVKRTRH